VNGADDSGRQLKNKSTKMFAPTREIAPCNTKPSWKVERPFTATVRANIFGNFIPSMAIFKREKCRSKFADGSPGQFVGRHYWFCVLS
jgi:hypothetical protein